MDRCIEHHRITPQEALFDYHMRELPPEDADDKLAELEKQVEGMGAINLTAIDECRELEKRHDFLRTQAGVASTQFATVVNGQRESFSTMTLDGVSVQDNYLRGNDLDFSPNQFLLDQVQEFTITTSLSGSAVLRKIWSF